MLVIKKKSSRLMPGKVKNNDRINIICRGFGKTELTNTQSEARYLIQPAFLNYTIGT